MTDQELDPTIQADETQADAEVAALEVAADPQPVGGIFDHELAINFTKSTLFPQTQGE
jgi:hypothetical protein